MQFGYGMSFFREYFRMHRHAKKYGLESWSPWQAIDQALRINFVLFGAKILRMT